MSSVLLIVDTAVPHFPSWMNLASVMLSWKWMFSPAFLAGNHPICPIHGSAGLLIRNQNSVMQFGFEVN